MSIDQYSSTPASNDLANYFRTGMRPSAVKTAGWDIMADLASYIVGLPTAGGTANAITASNGRPFGSLVAGLLQVLNPASANTGPATFAPDGLAVAPVFAYGAALAGGEIQPNVPALFKYDGTNWNLLNPNPAGKNFFVDPCCRVAQGDGTTNLGTNYKYGLVDLVNVKGSGTAISAGTITQDTTGVIGSASTTYACKAAGVTITGSGKIFFRRWIESRDAVALKNKTVLFSVLCRHDVAATITGFFSINKATTQDNFGATTNIGTQAIPTSMPNGTDVVISMAQSMGDCSNGVEVILEIDCGAITTKNFYVTDWQACISTLSKACVVPDFSDDCYRVYRYFETSYELGTAPGTTTNAGRIRAQAWTTIPSGTSLSITVRYRVSKVIGPALTIYSPNTGTTGRIYDSSAGANVVVTGSSNSKEAHDLFNSSGNPIPAGDLLFYHFSADARL